MGAKISLKEVCKNFILYYAENLVRVSLSRLYKLYYSKKIKGLNILSFMIQKF